MELKIDGNLIKSQDALYAAIKEQISLPNHFGNNLDALWDALTEINSGITIIINNKVKLKENLGEYGDKLIKLFHDLINENNAHKLLIK